ncbi:head closure [Acidovorax phage ACP17]|uniref:Head completion nuclease n=1 Tax=Acidovorax phage ACP17 TaxID=2010329 RepID=A0A218M3E8_9CAUD|nr:head closure [Acidovorax phage ACP17]ASD50576.1 head completion protein [Acidovorax phage ACP17]
MTFPKATQFHPKNPQKYVGDASNIVMRSSWERKLANWCDINPSVLKWNSEEIVIPYFSRADNKNRRYFLDFIAQIRAADGSIKTLLIEVKPDAQTKPPKKGRGRKESTVLAETYTYMVNQDKWEAARAFAAKHGMEFVVLNEYDLGISQRKPK